MPVDRPDDYPDRGLAIRSVGIRWYHPPGFLVDRPSGSGDFAFMQWLTDSRIRINGIERLERAGGCVVFRPEDPQWFGGDTFTPFGNSWFHFHGPEAGALLADCSIPTNRVLRLRDDSFVEPLLNLFLRESMARPRLWHRLIESGLQRFLLKCPVLSRGFAAAQIRQGGGTAKGVQRPSLRGEEKVHRAVVLEEHGRVCSSQPFTIQPVVQGFFRRQPY